VFPFTHAICRRLEPEARVHIIEMMWEVAYADGVLDPHEDMLLRRIAGLIAVSDRERTAGAEAGAGEAGGGESEAMSRQELAPWSCCDPCAQSAQPPPQTDRQRSCLSRFLGSGCGAGLCWLHQGRWWEIEGHCFVAAHVENA
jgi:hypothetical protein